MNVEQAQLSMNIFDAIVIGVLCLSSIVAFFRGFVREILSLGAWIGAAVITVYFFPQATQFMKGHVKSEHVAAGSAAMGTYFSALLGLSILNAIIIRYIKSGSEVGMLDNALGLVFGFLRGVFIVSLAFLIMSSVIPKENPPVWLKTSVTKNYLRESSAVLAKMAPRYLSNLEEIVQKQKERDQKSVPPVEGEEPVAQQDSVTGAEDSSKESQDIHRTIQRLINEEKSQQEGKSTDDKQQ